MRRPFIAGNWKMNTVSATARELAAAVASELPHGHESVDVLVSPPFPYLTLVKEAIGSSPVLLSGQDCSPESPGAFTGDVAVEMLKDVGCSHVIIGHSERRHGLGETDAVLNRKVKAALAGGLDVILCVGELLAEREAGRMEAVLDSQMNGGLDGITAEDMQRVTIAYEPVWAIGTGVTASPEQVEAAHNHLRNRLRERYNVDVAESVRILYGGSVKPDNAASLLGRKEIDGALIGGASLKADSFLAIVAAGVETAG